MSQFQAAESPPESGQPISDRVSPAAALGFQCPAKAMTVMDESSAPAGWRSDAGRLAVLLLLAALLHGWLIAHTEVLARDGTGFVRYALLLKQRPWREVIAGSHQHPLYPVTVLGVSWPVCRWLGSTPETMRLSAQLAASAAGVLLVIPVYLLGRALFDRRVGFWTAVLIQCLPVTARILSDALSDALCLFLVATALWLGVRALRTASLWRFAGCGLCGGLAYLTRPEGILPVVVVGLVWLAMQAIPTWRQTLRRMAACAASLSLATLVVAGPLVAVSGHLSTKPAAQSVLSVAGPVTPAPLATADAGATLMPTTSPGHDTPAPSALQGVRALARTVARDYQSVGWLPALIGLCWFHRRWRRQPEAWALLLLCVLLGVALVRLSMVVGYLGERHAQLLVLCSGFWAVALVAAVGDWLAARWSQRWLAPALLTALTAFGLPVLAKPLHANLAGYRTAGRWLAVNSQPEDQIIDWHCLATYYAGRLCPGPAAEAPASVRYAVMEEPQRTALPADVQQQLDEVIREGTVVFRCPVDSGRCKGAEVVIYTNRPTYAGVSTPSGVAHH